MATEVTVVLRFDDEDVYGEEELTRLLEDELTCVVVAYEEEDM